MITDSKENYQIISIKLKDMKLGFANFLKDKFKEYNFDLAVLDFDLVLKIQQLMFGIDPDETDKNRKIELIKDRNAIKLFIWNKISSKRLNIGFLKDIAIYIDDYLNEINDIAMKIEAKSIEEEKLIQLIQVYSWDSSRFRSDITTLSQLLSKAQEAELKMQAVKYCKPDNLKRYYFNYVYDLKHSISYFNNKTMIFGEINTIMNKYTMVSNFLFSDFMAIYSSLTENIESFISKSFK